MAVGDAFRDADYLVSLVVNDRVGRPLPVAVTVLLDLEPISTQSQAPFGRESAMCMVSYQPPPTPESDFASLTFLRYAITGPCNR